MTQTVLTLLSSYPAWNHTCRYTLQQQVCQFRVHALLSDGLPESDMLRTISTTPDILLVSLDLAYPGLTLLASLRRAKCDAAIVALSLPESMPTPQEVARLEIAGLVSVFATFDDIVAEIQAVAEQRPAPCLLQHLRVARTLEHMLKEQVALTERERQMIMSIAHGCTDHEIATMLNISARTVSNTLYRLYERLDVKGRAELVAYCLEKGLLTF